MSDADVSSTEFLHRTDFSIHPLGPSELTQYEVAADHIQMNAVAALDDAIATKAQQKVEDLQRATDAGWQKPIPFEYGGVGEPDTENGEQDEAKWLSDAVVYEWVDDYGEVGPENLALEKELFGDSESEAHHQNANFRAYESFVVNIDGSEKIQPFRNVSRS